MCTVVCWGGNLQVYQHASARHTSAEGEPWRSGLPPGRHWDKTDAMEQTEKILDHPDLPQESGSGQNPSPTTQPGATVVNLGSSEGWICPICGRSFRTKAGLGQHKRKAHPVLANEEAAPNEVKRRWREEEVLLLARTEAQLTKENGKCTGRDLHAQLPQLYRTLEAVKGKRRGADYKGLVKTFLEEMSLPAPVPTASGCPCSDQHSQSAQPTCAEVTSEDVPTAGEPETVVGASISPNAERTLSRLLKVAEGRRKRCGLGAKTARRLLRDTIQTEAALEKMSSRKRRRIECARVQELFRKSTGRIAAEIITGQSRGVKHSLAELEAYWRPILEEVSEAPGPTAEEPSGKQRVRRSRVLNRYI